MITIISDTEDTKSFTLVDSEGSDITGQEQLGLLLYGGRTVCIDNSHFKFKVADAICREMNYTRATYWTTSSSEGFRIKSQYYSDLRPLYCDKEEWKSCSFSENSCGGYSSYALHINCTGNR